jgi:hypothetical protein
MGPIANYASDQAITGRAGIYPSRYQSDKVDRCNGPLVRRANRKLRGVIMIIAGNLLNINQFFQTLQRRWQAAGMDERAMCVRGAKRFCRIAYQMVAGGQVFRHPSCQKRDAILHKLSCFHADHGSSMAQVMTDLQAAVDHIPKSEHTPEAKSLFEAIQPSSRRQQCGPRRLGEILTISLGQVGGDCCRIELEGGERPHVTARAEEPINALRPRGFRSLRLKRGALSDHQRLIRRRGVTPLMYHYGDM